jgi:hypothetical protein
MSKYKRRHSVPFTGPPNINIGSRDTETVLCHRQQLLKLPLWQTLQYCLLSVVTYHSTIPMAAARVPTRVSSCGICGGQSGVGTGFLRVLRFPLPIFIPPISPQSPSPIILGWYNRPVVAVVLKVPPHKFNFFYHSTMTAMFHFTAITRFWTFTTRSR